MALQKFPGLIDIHVHLRDPGALQKEDFVTGSKAAVKGGFTFLCDMPNNPGAPTLTIDRLEEKIERSKSAVCSIGFHYGTDGENIDTFGQASRNPHVFGLKIYCNHTTGDLLVENERKLDNIFSSWKSDKPILVHAEGEQLSLVLELAKSYKRRLHVCHVSRGSEVVEIRKAKELGMPVSSGVTPHHLYLTREHLLRLGAFGLVKPEIMGESESPALWEGLKSGAIDMVESDHAPHTKEEKESNTPPFGMPGLETTLGILLTSVNEKKASIDEIIRWLYENPKKIFSIPEQKNTYIELDPQKPYSIGQFEYETKCGWSPFEGWEAYGRVENVILEGRRIVWEGKLAL
jgi:dihydroorotase-like cyclic amidohydrolase